MDGWMEHTALSGFFFSSTKWLRQNCAEGGQACNQLSIYSPAPHSRHLPDCSLPCETFQQSSVWFDGTELAWPRVPCLICLLVMILASYPWSRLQPALSWFLFAALRLITWFYCSCCLLLDWLSASALILSETDLLPALIEPTGCLSAKSFRKVLNFLH